MKALSISGHSLNSICLCGRRVLLEIGEKWEPNQKGAALEHGDLMHKMLKHYYNMKKLGYPAGDVTHAKMITDSIAVGREAVIDMDISIQDSEEDIKQFRDYCVFYHQDGIDVIDVEVPFTRVLYERPDEAHREGCPTPELNEFPCQCGRREGLKIIYEGIIDLIARYPGWGGITAVTDHKTSKRRQTASFLSNQFLGYGWSWELPDVVVNKIGYQKSLPAAERFKRQLLHVPKQITQEWLTQAVYWTHELVKYYETGYFPPNFTSCDKYSGCIFKPVCESIPEVRQFKLETFYQQKPRMSVYDRTEE